MLLGNDLRYGLRLTWKNKLFTLTVVLTLALCIGANTAIFSVVDAALFRPLPYPEPDRLVTVVARIELPGSSGGTNDAHTGAMWEAIRDATPSLDKAVYSDWISGVNLAANGQAGYLRQQRTGSGFFRVLGVQPVLGRDFSVEEDTPGGPQAVILSHHIWQRYFRGDPAVIGSSVLLRGQPFIVTGIMPAGFRTTASVDLWTPLRASRSGEGGGTNYRILGRVPPGSTPEQVRTQLASLGDELIRQQGLPKVARARFDIISLQQGQASDIRTPILLLWGAVGAVLLIGCVNIGGMLLARTTGRLGEIGTRLALGAERGAILRQMLAETGVLALLGGAAGIAAGALALRGLRALAAEDFPVLSSATLDARVLGAALALTLLTALICGVVPAGQASRLDIRNAIGTARSVSGRRRRIPMGLMVAGQVALTVPLLVGSGLLIRTLSHLWNLNPGFDASNVVTARFSLQDNRYIEAAKVNDYVRKTLARLREIPGVESAAVSLSLPYERGLNMPVRLPGVRRDERSPALTNMSYVTPEYFSALKIPLLSGRVLTDSDTAAAAKVAVVNEAFAKTYFSGVDPIGQSIQSGKDTLQVVGVVGSAQQRPGWGNFGPLAPVPAFYMPLEQTGDAYLSLVHTWFSPSWIVRGAVNRAELIPAIQRAAQSVDPLLPIASFRTLDEIKTETLSFQRLLTTLLGGLGVLALALAVVGIYGLIANSVGERTREFGIRMALGSGVGAAVRDAVSPGLRWTLIGAAAGAFLAFVNSGLLKSFLWGVKPADPWTYAAVGGAMALVAGLAALVPALRVARLNPAETLRNE